MLVVIEIETKKIRRIIVDNEDYNLIDFYNRGKIVGDISDPVIGISDVSGNTHKLVFRDITDDEFKDGTYAFFKKIKAILISNITVLHNGVEYQGDEESQGRISRAINGLDDVSIIQWKAKNNLFYDLTKNDLIQILSLAIKEQTKIYVNNANLN